MSFLRFRSRSSSKTIKKDRAASSVPPAGAEGFCREAADVSQVYTVGEELGKGGFAVVKRGTDLNDGSEWALKFISQSMYKKHKGATDSEVRVLQALGHHAGVVHTREVVKTDKFFVIVMELLSGGELFDRIIAREKYSERDAKAAARSVLETVAYIHDKKCAHRDLKPENLLYKDDTDAALLKITDFGFAEQFEVSGELQLACGTPEYVAPEVLAARKAGRKYNELCDVWSVGVITYILLCGFPPFYSQNGDEKAMYDNIKTANFAFTTPYWDPVSDSAKQFVRDLLTVDVRKRPTAQAALEHAWFSDRTGGDLSGAITDLKRFNATRKLRAGVLTVIASHRIKNAFSDSQANKQRSRDKKRAQAEARDRRRPAGGRVGSL